MKTFLKQIFDIGLVVLTFWGVLASCKKNPITPVTPPVTVLQSCRLTSEVKDFQSTYQQFSYTYTQDGKLDSVYLSLYPAGGNIAWCKINSDGFLWTTYENTDNKTPDLFDYLYEGHLQDSANFPPSLFTSFQLYSEAFTSTSFPFTFNYNSDRKLQDVTQYSIPPNAVPNLITSFTYTKNGDIASIVYGVLTGHPNTTTVTIPGYDGHPSPYTGIAGFAFLSRVVSWTGAEYDPLLYALSAHNPNGSTFGSGSSQYSETMSYEYNAQGYPITRTVVRTGNDGTSFTYTHHYTYDCK